MQIIQKLLLTITTISLTLFSLPLPAFAAVDCSNPATTKEAIQCGECGAAGQPSCTPPTKTLDDTIHAIVNVLTAAVGIVAVIMIIIGGFRYVTSAGNPESAKNARNTILYAVIGLIIVAVAQLVVHFVLRNVT